MSTTLNLSITDDAAEYLHSIGGERGKSRVVSVVMERMQSGEAHAIAVMHAAGWTRPQIDAAVEAVCDVSSGYISPLGLAAGLRDIPDDDMPTEIVATIYDHPEVAHALRRLAWVRSVVNLPSS